MTKIKAKADTLREKSFAADFLVTSGTIVIALLFIKNLFGIA